MSYLTHLNTTTNDVACLAARLLIDYQSVNNFTFQGFPSISVESDRTDFYISIGQTGQQAGPLTIGHKAAAKQVAKMRKLEQIDPVLRRQFGDLAQELEAALRD